MHTFTAKLTNLETALYKHGIFIPDDLVDIYLNQNSKRVVLTFPNGVKHQGALMPKGNNVWFITISKALQKETGYTIGDEFTLQIETDPSKYGMPVPKEFEELLAQDPAGKAIFEGMAMSHQRNLIRIINQFKSSQKRIEKSIIIVDYVVQNNGKIDYKAFHQALKNHRFKA